ncbi:MAG: cytochrome oxidase putative small subunit CydP [Rhodanobacteraceae bacterium]
MQAAPDSDAGRSWFRTRGGRRFGLEFGLIVSIKIVLLVVIWAVCFRPHPRPDTGPAAITNHLLAPSAEAPNDR